MKQFQLLFLIAVLLILVTRAETSAADATDLNPTRFVPGEIEVQRLDFAAGDAILRITYEDGSTARLDIASGELLRGGPVALSPVGDSATADGAAITLSSGSSIAATASVRDLALNPQATRLAAALSDQTVAVYDTATGEAITTLDANGRVLQFNPEGSVLAVDHPALNQVILWEESRGSIVLPGQSPVAFSPDGTLTAIVSDQTEVILRRTADILAQDEDITIATLKAHYGRITDMAFSPDSTTLATASRDGSLSLWDALTGQQHLVLMGHRDGVTALAFSPDGSQLASVGMDGALHLWDTRTGALLQHWTGTYAALTDVAFAADTIVTGSVGGSVVVYSPGSAVQLPAFSWGSTANPPLAPEDGVIGSSRQTLNAGAHPLHPVGCIIAEDTPVLALGRSNDGGLLLRTPACEGPVWTARGTRYFNWENRAALRTLPLIEIVPPSSPRLRLADRDAICDSARGSSPAIDSDARSIAALYPPEHLPAAAQASHEDSDVAVICHDYQTVPIENCHYLGPGLFSYIFTRSRLDDVIRLVDLASGEVIASQRFNGQPPPACPQTTTRGEVIGEPAPPETWVSWALETTGHQHLVPLRTRVEGTSPVTLYDLPNGQPIAELTAQGAVTPLAESNGWLLVLLPDLSEGWLEADSVELAASVATLPSDFRTARQMSVATVAAPPIAEFTSFRPLGRVRIPAQQIIPSPDRLYRAAVQQQSGATLLSMWDIRGGQAIWEVSLPNRDWESMVFSPEGDTLLVKTNAPFPAEEEIRFTIYDAFTGAVISETGDVDIIDSPIIPGNLPQQLNAGTQYTRSGDFIVVDYWRRAESPRCAVWRVSDAALVWELEDQCGVLSEDGRYMLVDQPFTEIFSAYNQVMVYEVSSGAAVAASKDEAVRFGWLNDRTVFIYRPYGEAPVIWDILDDTTAVMELPGPLGAFLPTALNRVMFFDQGQASLVWDIATGELLGSSNLRGQLVEQPERVLILQEVVPEDSRTLTLRAVNLENNAIEWELPWSHRLTSVREDGLFGLAFNNQDGRLDIINLQNGTIAGRFPLTRANFTLTEDWQWIIEGGGHESFIVWGMPDAVTLFNDPPQVRVTAEVQAYYEANTNFPAPRTFFAGTYLWVDARTADSEWIELDDGSTTRLWLPASSVEYLVPVETLAVWEN